MLGAFFDGICVTFECWLCLASLFFTMAAEDADACANGYSDSFGYDGNIAGIIRPDTNHD